MSIFPEDVDPQFVNQGTSSDRDMKLVFPFCEVIISSDSQGKEWKVHTDFCSSCSLIQLGIHHRFWQLFVSLVFQSY